jgi:outer membrane protein, multidrug efflux system
LAVSAAALLSGCSIMPADLADLREEIDRQAATLPKEVLARPLSVEDAVNMALAHNLDARVKSLDEALAAGRADLSLFSLLPEMAAKGNLSRRNPQKTTTSKDLSTGEVAAYSVGEDKISRTGDLTASWNLVDFGIALLRLDQAEDKMALAAEKRRRAAHLLVQDVQAAYWKAVINEFANRKYASLESRFVKSVDDAETAERTRVGDPMQMLGHQRTIVDTMRQIAELQRQTATAKAELAGLMGIPSASAFTLEELKDDSALAAEEPDQGVEAMEATALANRPELKTEEAQFRIDRNDIRTELLKTLPGIGPFMGGHYDSNTYIKYNAWADAGLHMAWNLVDILSTPKRVGNAQMVAETTRARRLAMGMAVRTQVHVADIQVRHALKEYRLAEQIAAIDRRITSLAEKSKKAGSGSAMEAVKAEAAGMLSTLRRFILYSDLQGAKARLRAAEGIDHAPPSDAFTDSPPPETLLDAPAASAG